MVTRTLTVAASAKIFLCVMAKTNIQWVYISLRWKRVCTFTCCILLCRKHTIVFRYFSQHNNLRKYTKSLTIWIHIAYKRTASVV
jgi:hypothetical protein